MLQNNNMECLKLQNPGFIKPLQVRFYNSIHYFIMSFNPSPDPFP